MKRTRISVVKYTNSLPFIYGLENHHIRHTIDVSLDTPADCYEKLLDDRADVGLVPVVILDQLDYAGIISPFCIGTKGKVRSVILASSVPLRDIQTIYLDYQSRTSVTLVQVLARKFWNISPEFRHAEPGFEERSLQNGEAAVVIGDRAFGFYSRDYLITDLGEEWNRHTGNPFVFACWVSNKPMESEFELLFPEALSLGLQHRDKLAEELQPKFDPRNVDLKTYFNRNINYNFGPDDKKGMNLFLNLKRVILNP